MWSQQNVDFYGRDNAQELVDLPFRGFVIALVRARIAKETSLSGFKQTKEASLLNLSYQTRLSVDILQSPLCYADKPHRQTASWAGRRDALSQR